MRVIEEKVNQCKKKFLLLCANGGNLLEIIAYAIEHLGENDSGISDDLANKIQQDYFDLNDSCVEVLALYHPEAKSLRTILTIYRIAPELDRIADLSISIHHLFKAVYSESLFGYKNAVLSMVGEVRDMLQKSIQAFIEEDDKLAYEVIAMDLMVNNMRNKMVQSILNKLDEKTAPAEAYYNLLKIIQKLERIGDLNQKFSENILYLIDGKVMNEGVLLERFGA